MTGKDGKRFILYSCAIKKHDDCNYFHPENNDVTCDCICHEENKDNNDFYK